MYLKNDNSWVAFCVLMTAILLLLCIVAGNDASADDYPTYWLHDEHLVNRVQERLNFYGYDVEVDGRFGPETAAAVKKLQLGRGMRPTGVVDDAWAWTFQVENWPYNQGYTLLYMADLNRASSRSQTGYLIWIALGGDGYDPARPYETGSYLSVFRNGHFLFGTPAITGSDTEARYFTPVGAGRRIKNRSYEGRGSKSKWRWISEIGNNLGIHGLLEYYDSREDNQILGAHVSDGSIRVPSYVANWIFDKIPDGTSVVIDDRNFHPIYSEENLAAFMRAEGYLR
ncbi:murein L,D-transpeptidase [Candidatus Saccharibacteria bacterium]|nr:murein L,D-transpeptidase [Candidatus Saccharibacteria bacterium]